MPKQNSITTAVIGEVFGRLTVVGYGERNRAKQVPRVCRCECGVELAVFAGHLRDGHTRSCGCLEREVLAVRNAATAAREVKYHRGDMRAYQSWQSMIQRCENVRCRIYKRYGGRGIAVCARWRESFDAFLKDMGGRPPRTTLDRIDNDGNYEPGNCRWATAETQANNRGNNVTITHDGVTLTVPQWARKMGMKPITLEKRIDRGWTVEDALTRPTQSHS